MFCRPLSFFKKAVFFWPSSRFYVGYACFYRLSILFIRNTGFFCINYPENYNKNFIIIIFYYIFVDLLQSIYYNSIKGTDKSDNSIHVKRRIYGYFNRTNALGTAKTVSGKNVCCRIYEVLMKRDPQGFSGKFLWT